MRIIISYIIIIIFIIIIIICDARPPGRMVRNQMFEKRAAPTRIWAPDFVILFHEKWRGPSFVLASRCDVSNGCVVRKLYYGVYILKRLT